MEFETENTAVGIGIIALFMAVAFAVAWFFYQVVFIDHCGFTSFQAMVCVFMMAICLGVWVKS